MSPPAWISALRPVGVPRLEPLSAGSDLLTWHAEVRFKRWSQSPGAPALSWSDTYGKTQIVGEDGARSVAEIELVRRLRAAEWSAGWVDTFGSAPAAWASWIMTPDALPPSLRGVYVGIRAAAASTAGGRPDVVAWLGDALPDLVFVECKGPNDRIRSGQDAWFRAALQAGLSQNQLGVAHWREVP
jgi:hypothetical protein